MSGFVLVCVEIGFRDTLNIDFHPLHVLKYGKYLGCSDAAIIVVGYSDSVRFFEFQIALEGAVLEFSW